MKSEELKYKIDNKIRENIIYIHTNWSVDKLKRYVCAFLNTSGGALVFGIKDDGLNLILKKSVFDIFSSYKNIVEEFSDEGNVQYGKLLIDNHNVEYIEVEKSSKEYMYNGVIYYFDDVKREPIKKIPITMFLSYCQKDKGIANIVEEKLKENEKRLEIFRDIREVEYRDKFSEFMQTISDKDFVLSFVSDRYLKSRNCMYEMSELMRDRKYESKLLFIIVSDSDKKYCLSEDLPDDENQGVGAHIYDVGQQTEYLMYWQEKEQEMKNAIEKINDPVISRNQISELEVIKTIELKIRDLMSTLFDRKGISFEEMLNTNFIDMMDIIRNKK